MNNNFKFTGLKLWCYASTAIIIIVACYIFGYIAFNGHQNISLEFIFSEPKGMPLGMEGGVFPAIIGTISLGLLSCLTASLLGIATAIYSCLYCNNNRIKNCIKVTIQSIAGIPSIVLGLFGYTFFVVYLNFGISLLAGGLTLGIMVFPVVAVTTEKALSEIDNELIMSSYALGVSKSYTFFKVLLPRCKSDIISGIMLATSFAMGATAPIILTSAVIFAHNPISLTSPVMALPFHLYIFATEGISLDKAYGTALVLLVIVLTLNIMSMIVSYRKE